MNEIIPRSFSYRNLREMNWSQIVTGLSHSLGEYSGKYLGRRNVKRQNTSLIY